MISQPHRAHRAIIGAVSPVRTTWTAAAALAAATGVSAAGAGATLWVPAADRQPLAPAVLVGAVMLAFAVVGAVVAAARPANRVGWLMLAGAALSLAGNGGAALARHGLVTAPGSVPGASGYAVAGQCCRSLGWYLLTLAVPAHFPTGALPRPGWRWLRRLLPVVLAASVAGPLLDARADLTGLGTWRNPVAPPGSWQVLSGIAFAVQVPGGLVVAGGVVALLLSRWRQGSALLRQQIALFVAAAAVPIVAVPIVLAVGYGSAPWVFGATALPLPFALGFAVLARGLYDLRTAANRTLVWGTLSAAVAGLYALVIAGLGNRLAVRGAPWLPWVAAAAVAVSFAPLRDVLQRGVNRVTFGRWDEPYEVLASLGQRLEATAEVGRLLDQVVAELRGLGLAGVCLLDARGDPVAGGRSSTSSPTRLPLTSYGRPVGTLVYDPPANPLRARDRRLLDALGGHLGGVLHARELTLDVQRARERLVLAREEERRRLRRDLHDGLGPSLAGHLLRLDLIAARVDRGSPAAADLGALRADLQATMLDVRRLVEGLRPPALDELGLVGAIEQVTRRLTGGTPVRMHLEVDQLPQLPAAVEVAAFRIVTEAATNVVRHARASTCTVRIGVATGRLRVEVRDDGCGLDDRPSAGHGLHTMRERAEELGGSLRVRSGGGTSVEAQFPLPAVPRARAPRAAAGAS